MHLRSHNVISEEILLSNENYLTNGKFMSEILFLKWLMKFQKTISLWKSKT